MSSDASGGAQAPAPNFNAMPEELKQYRNWIAWKFEQRPGAGPNDKPTKVPYCATSGAIASSTDPKTWASFDEGRAVYERGGYAGIGFVFGPDDPFAGIDLDDSDGDETVKARQDAIFNAFESYSEVSPSGKGCHIIVRGSIPQGKRRDSVELYSSARFFTMTGNVIGERRTITDQHARLNALWHDMGGSVVRFDPSSYFRQATSSDEEVFNRAASGGKGAKFLQLWNGNPSSLPAVDRTPSVVDLVLANILQFYTKDPSQIERLLLASPQGQRWKMQHRPRYRRDTILKAFDRELPPVDLSLIEPQLAAVVEQAQSHARARTETALPIVWASELANRPLEPPEWLVEQWIVARNVTLLYGDGGTGKSLLALMLTFCVAADRRWLGLVVRSGPALFLTAEDEVTEAHRRLAAISRAVGIALDAMPYPLAIVSLADRDALLAAVHPQSRVLAETLLYEALRAHIEQHRPAVVILDTLADLFGGNENDRGQARWFIGILRRLAITYDCAIVLLAHPSRDGIATKRGDGGSTAWHNSVRSRLYMTEVDGEPDRRILETKKANYGRKGATIDLEYRAGAFVAMGAHANDAEYKAATEQSVDDVFLTLVAEFNTRGHCVSPSHNSPMNYAPKLFAKNANSGGFNPFQFKDAMLRLFANNRIKVVKFGPYDAKTHDHIVIVTSVSPSGSISK